MNYIQAEAWAVDRALNFIQNTDNKDVSPERVIEIANIFASHMHEVVKTSGQLDDEMQKAIDEQVEARLFQIEVEKAEELKNGTAN